jgi:hypothetical protein
VNESILKTVSGLFEHIANERQQAQVAGTLNGSCYAALKFQAVAGDAAWQQFALLVDKLKQKVSVFVIDVFDAEFAETAVFLTL